LLVIPARRFSTAEGLVKLGSSAFRPLSAKALDDQSCSTSPSAVEKKRLAGVTREKLVDQAFLSAQGQQFLI